MTTQISDNRKYESMTVEDADALFQQIAELEIAIDRDAALTEKKISDLKAAHVERTADQQEEHDRLVDELNKYIRANKNRFITPRQHQTSFGKYGLRTARTLQIADEESVIKTSDALKLKLYNIQKVIDKKAVTNALLNKTKIPGATLISGDLATYSVDKALTNFENMK